MIYHTWSEANFHLFGDWPRLIELFIYLISLYIRFSVCTNVITRNEQMSIINLDQSIIIIYLFLIEISNNNNTQDL